MSLGFVGVLGALVDSYPFVLRFMTVHGLWVLDLVCILGAQVQLHVLVAWTAEGLGVLGFASISGALVCLHLSVSETCQCSGSLRLCFIFLELISICMRLYLGPACGLGVSRLFCILSSLVHLHVFASWDCECTGRLRVWFVSL